MKHFQQRKKKRGMMYSKWVAAVLLFFIIVIMGSVYDLYSKKKQVVKLRSEAQMELATIQQKDAHITKELENLATSRGQEEIMRQKYNIKKEGEGVIIVTDKPAVEGEIPVVDTSIYRQVLDFFGTFF